MKRLTLFLFAVLLSFTVSAQQWGMYTLYSNLNGTVTYLIDTASSNYHTWSHSSSNKTGYSCYMIEGDTLLRSYVVSNSSINGAGASGGIQKVTWDGEIAWDWTYSTSTYQLHHDIHPMPNGNVLVICYDKRTSGEMTQAGSNDAQDVLSDKIMEVKPTGATTGEIVWEWVAWDHKCQDYNSSKDDYVSSLSDNPQLLNINYGVSSGGGPPKPPPGGQDADWLHLNGIDYNAELDQITFSSHNFNELYIIDHSTTTEEAAGHTGGNSGKGGDILYRWGNPEAYDASGTANFDVIHDAHWISEDHPEYGGCLVGFNNEGGSGGKAAIDIITPPLNGNNYDLTPGQAYAPATYIHRYTSNYTSMGQSSSEQFPNGNMMLCVVNQGATYLYEIDLDGTSIWSKTISGVSPQAHRYEKCFIRGIDVTLTASETAISEGELVTLNTTATAITESSPTFTYNWNSSPEGFTSTDANPTVTPNETTTYYLTVTNNQSGCADEVSITINVEPVSVESNIVENDFNIYPNPNNGIFTISASDDFSYTVLSSTGNLICTGKNNPEIDLSNISEGVYYVVIEAKDIVKTEKLIIIK